MDSKAAVAAISKGDWQGLKAFVAQASPEAAYELIRMAYSACPMTLDIGHAVAGPDDRIGLTLAGAFHFGIAKRHRGGAGADQVTEKQWAPYIENMQYARAALAEALTLDKHYGLAAAFNMAVASDEFEEGQKDEAEALLLDARDAPLSGYMNLLQARLEKWGGSHEDMFRIARSRMRDDAPMQHALIARAHFERHLFYAAFDDSGQGDALAEGYFAREDVLADLKAASEAVLGRRDADPAEQRLANGWLAFVLSAAGKSKRALPHLDRIKGHDDPGVWVFSPLPPALTKGLIRLKAMVS